LTDCLLIPYYPVVRLSHISQEFASEIDIIIERKVHRTVIRAALDDLTYERLTDIVTRKLKHLGQLPYSRLQRPRIQYRRKDNRLSEVTEDFPGDTDLGWREFFTGVFYVDFPEGADMSTVAGNS
jgi:hypothetical protein